MNIERSFNNPLVSLIRPPMFWRPVFQNGSDWLDYAPFGFWIIDAMRPQRIVEVGTTSGNAYFAFCQAISSLQLNTQAVSVMDSGAGGQKSTTDLIQNHNSSSYGGFSRILSGAVSQLHVFDDVLVDLLHINVCSANALESTFKSWEGKLSDCAVVIIRLCQEFNESVEALSFLKRLKSSYLFFELTHGDGALIVQIGPEQSPIMGKLYQCNKSPAYKKVVKEVFSSLGLGCMDGYYARSARLTGQTLPALRNNATVTAADGPVTEPPSSEGDNRIGMLELELSEAKDHLEQLRTALSFRDEQIASAKSVQQKSDLEIARIQAALQDRFSEVAKLTQIAEDLNNKIRSVESDALGAAAKFKTQKTNESKKVAALEAQVASLDASLKAASQTAAEYNAKIKAQKTSESKKVAGFEAQIVSLNTSLKSANTSLAEVATRETDFKRQLDEFKTASKVHSKALAKRDSRIAELERELIKWTVSHDATKKANSSLATQAELLKRELQQEKVRVNEAEERNADVLKSLESEAELKQRIAELETLSASVSSMEIRLAEASQEISQLKSGAERSKQAYDKKLEERTKALAKARKDLEVAEHKVLELQSEVKSLTDIVFSAEDPPAEPASSDATTVRKQPIKSNVGIPLVGYVRKKLAPKPKTAITQNHQIEAIRKSGRFDTKWYVSQYPDVRDARVDPIVHYVKHGASEGRNPTPSFNTNNYLAMHPEIEALSLNPLYHFIESNR